jgi:pimeloyl-ACP methyl ester carboxylesterase
MVANANQMINARVTTKAAIASAIVGIAGVLAWFCWSSIIRRFFSLLAGPVLRIDMPVFAACTLVGAGLVFGLIWIMLRRLGQQQFVSILGFVILFFLLLVGFSFGRAIIIRASHAREITQRFEIHTPNGIQESMYVMIGGIQQWIQIRGEDRNNPVLLFVHGGPGAGTIPYSSGWLGWEKYFTVVQWDQRGASRTYRQTGSSVGPTMTVERMALDGIELVEFLRTHLHKNKVILVGHSWGSYLGIHMIKQRPDLFAAYVGTGQVVGPITWRAIFGITPTQVSSSHEKTPPEFQEPPIESTVKFWKARNQPFEEKMRVPLRLNPIEMPQFSLLDWYYECKGNTFSWDVSGHRKPAR